MNSYYSNLIEGHRTKPKDIDAALRKDFSADFAQRSLQMLHIAHVEVQREMEARLAKIPANEICSQDFLCWLHQEFYQRLPDSLRLLEDETKKRFHVEPGQLRDSEVSVGRHMAPVSRKLDVFLRRFSEFYGPCVTRKPDTLVSAAAAHHRLTWIHPFLDGNGRVARLFTHAWFIKAGVDSNGLWTLSRGLARRKAEYQSALANADEKRLNDLDGRGYLSARYLDEFCSFFLTTASDQVAFMQELLGLEGLLKRVIGFGQRKESAGELPSGSHLVLRELVLRGEIGRGEVSRIVGASPRSGQKVTGELLAQELITSPSPKGALRLAFPAEAAGDYFPILYPAGG
jgi:Fic family protein